MVNRCVLPGEKNTLKLQITSGKKKSLPSNISSKSLFSRENSHSEIELKNGLCNSSHCGVYDMKPVISFTT